jgi:hypothetical protein
VTDTTAPIGRVAAPVTVQRVARHLDRQRLLSPRDYAIVPELFGVDPEVSFHVPAGGDAASMHSAVEQHLLLCAWNQSRRPSAAVLGRRFRVSKQTLSRVSRGQRWAGHTVLAALLYATRQQQRTGSATAPVRNDAADPRPQQGATSTRYTPR